MLELEKPDKLSKSIHSFNFLEQVLSLSSDDLIIQRLEIDWVLVLFSLQTWIKFQYQLIHNRLKVKLNCTLVWCFDCSAWSNTVNLDEPCEVFEHYSLHRHPNLLVEHFEMVCICQKVQIPWQKRLHSKNVSFQLKWQQGKLFLPSIECRQANLECRQANIAR